LCAELLFLDHSPISVIEQLRRIALLGEALRWGTWSIQLLVAWLGLLWFLKMHGVLADVL